jgi:hypothetical protein
MKVYGIYKITNLINYKVYIGKSKDCKNRLKNHFSFLKNGKHGNKHLQNSFNKYGAKKFKSEIIYKTYNLDKWEKFFIFWYQSYKEDYGYNKTRGDDGNDFSNLVRTKEHCKHISEGLKRSEKAKYISSIKMINYNKSQIGIPLSEKRKKNISLGGKKSWKEDKTRGMRSVETRKKNGFLFRKEETKEKISNSLKGNKRFNNGIKNIYSKECPEGFVPGWI